MVSKGRIAVIPARLGSKRIPSKNTVDFCGKPMIAWTIEAALASGEFERVFVSTDDARAAEIAARCGVPVPFLRERATDDLSPVSAATLEALSQIRSREDRVYDEVAQLMPNCPLRSAATIASACRSFSGSGAKLQVSCFKFGWMNPWWAIRMAGDGRGRFLFPDALQKRSQDQEALYCPTGAIWIAKTAALEAAGTFHTKETAFFQVDWKEAVDIDDLADLEMAESVFEMMRRSVLRPADVGGR